VAWATDRTGDVVQYRRMGGEKRYTVSNSDELRRELECLRLEAECMQLVGDVSSLNQQRHFLCMARAWATEAKKQPGGAVREGAPAASRS
jgi:hypothetical protein